MSNFDSHNARKALVSLAIENALLEISSSTVEEVGNRLYAKYQCYFMDCLEHPEYLKDILKQVFGMSYNSVIQSIEKNLGEFSSQKSVAEFLKVING